jgi:AcrR family transcriptional regulator
MSRRQDRRDEIARVAVGHLGARGVRQVRLADVGAELGMTGAHLLYYFQSKDDLFLAALRVVEQDLRERVRVTFARTTSARERWVWLLDAGAPSGRGDRGLLLWLEAWARAVHDDDVRAVATELEGEWQGLLRETLEYAVARGELPHEVEVGPVVEGVSALLDGLTLRVVVGHRPLDRDAALAIVERFTAPLLPWREVS